jgi:hypothetical protein
MGSFMMSDFFFYRRSPEKCEAACFVESSFIINAISQGIDEIHMQAVNEIHIFNTSPFLTPVPVL